MRSAREHFEMAEEYLLAAVQIPEDDERAFDQTKELVRLEMGLGNSKMSMANQLLSEVRIHYSKRVNGRIQPTQDALDWERKTEQEAYDLYGFPIAPLLGEPDRDYGGPF